MALKIIFWLSAGALIFSYIIYPVLLPVLSWFRKKSPPEVKLHPENTDYFPRIIILFAAHNEEKIIEKKIISVFNSDYPAEKIIVMIGSDCSTDRTDDIIRNYSVKYPALNLYCFEKRTGKTGIINHLIEDYRKTSHQDDILILTDANVLFEKTTIKELVNGFSDSRVGLVGAVVQNQNNNAGISGQERAYIQRENRIKYYEGELWGAVMGAFGACYAIRPEFFPRIPANILMEDFFVTMHVIQKKKKAIINPKAVCIEDVSVQVREEFKRKQRISAGNFQNLSHYWRLLFRLNGVSFAFFSHKVLRWFGPFFIIGALISSAVLGVKIDFYFTLLIVQSTLLALSFAELVLQKLRITIAPLRLLFYFYAMNLALISGFFMFMRGIKSTVWSPTERQIIS